MDSLTKNRQEPATLKRMVERAYGLDLVPAGNLRVTEVTEGWFNVIYRVELTDGRVIAVKIAPPADVPVLTREIRMMRTELEAMRLIRDRTRVPIPRVHYADFTHDLVDADWFTMEFLPGQNFESFMKGGASAEAVARGYRQLGAFNRQINEVIGPHFGPLLGAGFKTWREALTTMVQETLADGDRVGINLGWDPDLISRLVAEHGGALDEVTTPRLVEVDLWAKNSLIAGGRIVAILDHERALYGDPLMEACFTGIDLPAFGDPTEFAAGYGLAELTEAERIRRRLYSVYLTVIMIVETKYRGHTHTNVYDFARQHLDVMLRTFGYSHG